jgi:hypothetical protein
MQALPILALNHSRRNSTMKNLIKIMLLAILGLLFLPFSHCQTSFAILPSYADSPSPALRVNAGDTIISLVDGYFINEKRFDMYQQLKSAASKEPLSFAGIGLDFRSYVESQEEAFNTIKAAADNVYNESDKLGARTDDIDAVLEKYKTEQEKYVSQLTEKVKLLERNLSACELNERKRRFWPVVAIPAAVIAGFILRQSI